MHEIKTDIQALNKRSPAPFSDDIIFNYGTYLREHDIHLKGNAKRYVAPIPLDKVIGIDQLYGDDSTWGQCLEGRWLKRLESRLVELEINPHYYLSETKPHNLSFIKVGDKFFISQGKHRTIIARFLAYFNPEIFRDRMPFSLAKVIEYEIDTEYAFIKKRFEAVAINYPALTFQLKHTTTEDDFNFLVVRQEKPNCKVLVFNRIQAYQVLESLENPSIKAKWQSSKGLYSCDIYTFISYRTCFKASYVNAVERLKPSYE